MRPRITVAAVLAIAACTHYYDAPEGWEGPFNAPEVLNRALEKSGSRIDPMEDAGDMTVTVRVKLLHDVDPVDAGYVVRWKRPSRFSIEVTAGPFLGKRIVCDGERLAEVVDGKVTRDLAKDDTAFSQVMNRLFVLQFFRAGRGSDAELKENTKGPKGDPWIRLAKTDPAGKPFVLMLDAATLEPRILQAVLPFQGGREHTIDTWFEDYRTDPRAGRVPFTWKSYDGDKLREQVTIQSLAWNQGIADREFAIP